VLAGAGGFDGGVEGEEVGLVGDARDGERDVVDLAGAPFEFLDDGEGALLALGVAVDGVSRCADLGGRLCEAALHRQGLEPRPFSLRASVLDRGRNAANGRALLLRCAGGFFSGGCDLCH
jgi:hypothetical protein